MKERSYVFIAGPYGSRGDRRDAAYLEIDRNIARAREAAAFLANNRVPFFCPHLNSCHFEVITPEVPMQYWYDLDMAILEPASAIWLLDGWQDSQGSQVELVHARVLQIKVFYPQDGARLVYWWGSD